MTNTALPIIVVVLGLKPASVAALIVRSTTIVDGIGASPTLFPSPIPPLAQVKGHIATLTSTESALRSRTGLRGPRDDAKKLLIADMQGLHAYVQQLVSANPVQAQVIVEAAAMTLKKKTAPHKTDLATTQKVSGSVKVVAKSVKGARSHVWQMSTDGGKTYVDLPVTTQSYTTVHSLQPGSTVFFRQRPVLKTGMGDWSQPISTLVT